MYDASNKELFLMVPVKYCRSGTFILGGKMDLVQEASVVAYGK